MWAKRWISNSLSRGLADTSISTNGSLPCIKSAAWAMSCDVALTTVSAIRWVQPGQKLSCHLELICSQQRHNDLMTVLIDMSDETHLSHGLWHPRHKAGTWKETQASQGHDKCNIVHQCLAAWCLKNENIHCLFTNEVQQREHGSCLAMAGQNRGRWQLTNRHLNDKTVEKVNGQTGKHVSFSHHLWQWPWSFNFQRWIYVWSTAVRIHCRAQEDIWSGQASTADAAMKYTIEGTYVKSVTPQEGTYWFAANKLHYNVT